MNPFISIRFKKDTAKQFQTFSRRFFKTHTEAFGPNGRTIANLIKKRFNAMVAIMKNMEKNGVLPTKAMMELLFENSPRKKRGQAPLLMEGRKSNPERDMFFKKVEEAIRVEKENTNLKRDLRQNREEFISLLSKIQLVKSSFGKSRLQLDMDPEDFEKLKIRLEKELQ